MSVRSDKVGESCATQTWGFVPFLVVLHMIILDKKGRTSSPDAGLLVSHDHSTCTPQVGSELHMSTQ